MLRFNYFTKFNSLYLLLLSTLFLFLGDAILSYLFPVVVEETVGSFTLVGVILSLSSLAGLTCDLLFPILFPNLNWKTSNFIGILMGISFPILLFLGQDLKQPLLFIAAAIVWGIYYEFLGFARQECVIEVDKQKNFTQTWGLIYSFLAFCAFVGPIIASVTLNTDQIVPRVIVFLLYFISLGISFVLMSSTRNPSEKRESNIIKAFQFIHQVKYWAILEMKTYPMLIVMVFLVIINAFFWTFGGLYGEELFGNSGFGWLLLVVYTLPDLIFSYTFSKFSIRSRKKSLSFIMLILCGLTTLPLLFITDNFVLISVIFVFSGFNSVAFVLMRAVFSDLESRAEEFKVHLEAVYQATYSIGYIIGPLLSGLLVQSFGFKETFVIFGSISIVIGIVLLIVTPDKLKLPKARLRSI